MLFRSEQDRGERREVIFGMDDFTYDAGTDTYRCPAGEVLRRRSQHKGRDSADYAASNRSCRACPLRSQCTTSKTSRTILRHLRQEEIDVMRDQARSWRSRRDLFVRQHLMEGSFARSTRYGFKQSRWRRIWRVRIQDYLTAAIQNMKILIEHGLRSPRAMGYCLPLAPRITIGSCSKAFFRFVDIIFSLRNGWQPAF